MALKITRCPENPIVRPGSPRRPDVQRLQPGGDLRRGPVHHVRAGLRVAPPGRRGDRGRPAGERRRRALPARVRQARLHARDGGEPLRQRAGPAGREDRRYVLHDVRVPAVRVEHPPHGPRVAAATRAPSPGRRGDDRNQTRSGIAVSKDRVHWEHLAWATPGRRGDTTASARVAESGRGSQAPRTAWGQPLGGTIPPAVPGACEPRLIPDNFSLHVMPVAAPSRPDSAG